MRNAALVGLLLGLVDATDARAANELCGQTITTDLIVTADQTCAGDGLIVGADDITIDLGGFTLSGDRDSGDIGIDLNHHSRVTIINGTVRGFDLGIHSQDFLSQSLRVATVTVRDSLRFGALLFGCGITVTHSSFIANGIGGLHVQAFCAKGAAVDSCAFVGNLGEAGLEFGMQGKGKVTKVVATGNAGDGVRLFGRGMSLRSSTMAGNGAHGVFVIEAGSNVKIANNVIVGNQDDGVHFDVGSLNVDLNVVASNLLAGNAGDGIEVANQTPNVAIVGNRAIGNGAEGVNVSSDSPNFVSANTAIGNAGSGFLASGPVTTFAKNVANGNAAGGIFAPTALDGGGNRARANGGTQCSPAITCPPAFTPKQGPSVVGCGTHVNTSIKLARDPMFCSGTNGLIVDADDITIDLNGHLFHGDRTSGTIGIDVGSHKNVTIKNGIIQGFGTGISTALLSNGLKVVNVEIRDSVALGMSVAADGAVIDKTVVVRNSGPGIVLGDFASRAKVRSSFIIANTGDGLTSSSPGGTLVNVTASGNVGSGIRLTGSGNGKLQGGTVSANRDDGITIDGTYGVLVPSVVKKTFIAGNANEGIFLTANAVAMTFDSNFSGGNRNNGIVLLNEPLSTLLKKNLIVGNASTGLFLGSDVTTTSVVQNRAVGNGLSGLQIFAAATTLTKNTAIANAFGISTALGVTDGGGNVARDNLDEMQCAPTIVCGE